MSNQQTGSPMQARELLDLYYLDMRSALLELAAGLDRIQRASGSEQAVADDRFQVLIEGCKLVATDEGDRALRFQKYLSAE